MDKEDYRGTYVIDRNYFSGSQADWQYNHFRFEITEDDSLFFYETDGVKILKTHKGWAKGYKPYSTSSARLLIKMNEPRHHVMSGLPTTYRDVWDFYLVFYSPKFNNMFFTKGKWRPIKD